MFDEHKERDGMSEPSLRRTHDVEERAKARCQSKRMI